MSIRRPFILAVLTAAVLAVFASPALAHVVVQATNEAVLTQDNRFVRFVVTVPNERPDADTTKIEVQLPESLGLVSFEPAPGWTRSTQTADADQPDEAGEPEEGAPGEGADHGPPPITSVTWEGGPIVPGEFQEFVFYAQIPDEPTTLEFPALQTYSSAEVVRWVGPPDSREPAATVTTPLEQGGPPEQAGDAASSSERSREEATDDDGSGNDSTAGVVLGIIGIAVGAAALAVAVLSRRRSARAPAGSG